MKYPKLTKLMEACDNCACNAYALINSLSEAIKEELQPREVFDNVQVKYIVMHIAFLLDETGGPTIGTFDAAMEILQSQKSHELHTLDETDINPKEIR